MMIILIIFRIELLGCVAHLSIFIIPSCMTVWLPDYLLVCVHIYSARSPSAQGQGQVRKGRDQSPGVQRVSRAVRPQQLWKETQNPVEGLRAPGSRVIGLGYLFQLVQQRDKLAASGFGAFEWALDFLRSRFSQQPWRHAAAQPVAGRDAGKRGKVCFAKGAEGL